ncbi:MAG: hypothetical protein RLZZ476_31 [Verrucomicrobiota bacterium]|jgi:hypothetical protein
MPHSRVACIDGLQRAESCVEVMVTKFTLVTGFFDFVVKLAAVLASDVLVLLHVGTKSSSGED